MTGSDLETIRIEPRSQARGSVVWLHGLGADGNDFVPIVPELNLPDELGARFIFPHAPVRPVTLNAGMPMRAWFDITGLDSGSRQDTEGLEQARQAVERLIAAETADGIAPGRIVMAGFSQGGALALYTGLHHGQKLAGIMGLSTWLMAREDLTCAAPANRDTPVFMAHGEQDPTLPFEFGGTSRDALRAAGYQVEWRDYPMGHEVCLEEIREIGRWLNQVLTTAQSAS
jgi:phospholipase/carboxylesterase